MDKMALSKNLHRLEGSEIGRKLPTMDGVCVGFRNKYDLGMFEEVRKECEE
jgi:hypothetical protein